MDKLSIEVLNSIFIQLHLINKLECMLVCRKWASIIRDTTLLDTIHLNNEQDSDRFFKMLLQDPSRGNQVKRLALNLWFDTGIDNSDLLELLPKLQFLQISIDDQSNQKNYYNTTRFDLKRLESSRTYIEHILDYRYSQFAFLFLSSGPCPRLTVLEVNLDHKLMDSFIDHLKNAPALRKLKIVSREINIANIEQLHANTPQLNSLSIEYSALIYSALPSSIKPAESLTSLLLHTMPVDIETHIVWLHFIRLKYTHLQHLGFKEHRTDDFPNEEIWNRMINNGLMPLLISLGTRLKSLALSTIYLEPDLFKKIDKCNSEIQQFAADCIRPRNVISHIIQSNQCKFIQKLKLERTPFFSMEILKEMICLKLLEIDFDPISKPTINLHRLFEFCPNTLETLFIQHAHLNCDATFNQTFPLKKFRFCGAILSKRVERFLSFCLPNLRSLYLISCISSGSRLMLSSINLVHLELEIRNSDQHPDLSVFTLDSNLRQYYTILKMDGSFAKMKHAFDYMDASLYRGQRRIPMNELRPNGVIIVECASIQKLVINGRLAC
ncbi:hypothetical protein K501DRAFT_307075 [Backusella circina FSU 941]|nr:hypothetical protein K501DRAFT_307075 [Backusella circina FSU 941]